MNCVITQADSSTKPRSIRLRFGIRSLMLLVTVVALLIGLSPKLWRTYRVHHALNTILATPPRFELGIREIELIAGDRDRIVAKLIEIMRTNDPDHRSLNAERLFCVLQTQPCSAIDRAKRLPQMIDVAFNSSGTEYESKILMNTIAAWIPSTGVTREERARIRSTSRERGVDAREPWIGILAAIGGREEIELLLEFADENNFEQRRLIIRRAIRELRWKGLLPYLERWLQDPRLAEEVLEMSLLSDSAEGRNLLVRFIANPKVPVLLRQKGMKRLLTNTSGIDQLVSACTDTAIAEEIEKLVGPDSLQYLSATRGIILSLYDSDFWSELFEVEDLYIKRQSNPNHLKWHQRNRELLTILTGESEIKTKADWEDWKETHNPDPITLETILQILIEHPELFEATAIIRRISPYSFGEISVNCQPLYDQLLRSKNPEVRFWVCLAMLRYSDSPTAVDVAIDLAESFPSSKGADSDTISSVKQRFAVNFFYDFKAWREWRENELLQ